MKFVLWGTFLLFCLLGVVMVLGSLAREDIKACTEAQEAVRAELRDPNSAHFESVVYHDGVVCGLVNAKNGYGGYSGNSRFIVVHRGPPIVETGDSDSAFQGLWTQYR